MKIAIIGTRGIPNNYGGFEQFAEYLAAGLVARGHQVTVYVPHYHSYQASEFKGIKLKRKFSPERFLGGGANLFYDYLCLKDAIQSGQEILLACGPGATVPIIALDLKLSHLVTNMDGIEWRRAKWNAATRRLVRWMESWAARKSHRLVADNQGIQRHLLQEYGIEATFIPYGADTIGPLPTVALEGLSLEARAYSMLIARLEPENNVEVILDGYVLSDCRSPMLVVGNDSTPYGTQLKRKYQAQPWIRFLGGIYDKHLLDVLRQHAKIYFHGHSVGGTNPSLLEAMACGACIAAHDNEFNRSVVLDGALYFSSVQEVAQIVITGDSKPLPSAEALNRTRIRDYYSWDAIVDQYEKLFEVILAARP